MKKIAIIMGGYSSEYKISLTSGNVVYQNLDKTKFKGYRIHIFKEISSRFSLHNLVCNSLDLCIKTILYKFNVEPLRICLIQQVFKEI